MHNALDFAAAAFTPERRDFGPQIRAVIAASSELREREVLKRTSFATAIAEALQERGVPDPSASLAAEMGVLALSRAYQQWSEPTNRQEFSDLARHALDELRAASSFLG